MSLTDHILEPGDHGRLGFHPGCAVCRRERLAGALSSEPLLSRRTQAALAAGVLALSTAAPPVAAVGAEPDNDREGIAAPEVSAPDAGANDPDSDPGGADEDLPSGDGGPPDDENGPVEQAPEAIQEPRVPDPEPDTGVAAPVAPGSVQVAPQAPAGAAPTSPLKPQASPPAKTKDKRAKAKKRRDRAQQRAEESAPSVPLRPLAPAGTRAPAPAGGAPQHEHHSGGGLSPAAGTAAAIPRGADSYLVRPGDSLWSIAKRLLGSDASNAQVASEVERLWQLNAERIGTGNPNLIVAGQKLAL